MAPKQLAQPLFFLLLHCHVGRGGRNREGRARGVCVPRAAQRRRVTACAVLIRRSRRVGRQLGMVSSRREGGFSVLRLKGKGAIVRVVQVRGVESCVGRDHTRVQRVAVLRLVPVQLLQQVLHLVDALLEIPLPDLEPLAQALQLKGGVHIRRVRAALLHLPNKFNIVIIHLRPHLQVVLQPLHSLLRLPALHRLPTLHRLLRRMKRRDATALPRLTHPITIAVTIL
mmetsp:Transcript_26952/g.47991  ORF Transcript_26952/g.47991 Transcript_26952/m.47991 type:complete len:227 (-) Transcript_26952:88-768(-)